MAPSFPSVPRRFSGVRNWFKSPRASIDSVGVIDSAFVAEALGALFLRLGEAEAARDLLGDVDRDFLVGDAVRFFSGEVVLFLARGFASFLVGDVLSVFAAVDLAVRFTAVAAILFFFSDLGIHLDGMTTQDRRLVLDVKGDYRFLTPIYHATRKKRKWRSKNNFCGGNCTQL